MNKSMPRIGRQEFLNGLDLLVQMVGYQDDLSEEELREGMEEENRRLEKQPFKSVGEWLDFAFDDKGNSLEILHRDTNGKVTLTEEGEKLLNSTNFEKSAFDLLERKSIENFRYFFRILQAFDNKVQAGKYRLGSNLNNEINTLMTDTGKGNSVTAGTIGGILRDFGVVEKQEGEWRIVPSVFAELRGNDKELVLELMRERGRDIALSNLENTLIMTFNWDERKVTDILEELENDNEVYITQREGKEFVQVIE